MSRPDQDTSEFEQQQAAPNVPLQPGQQKDLTAQELLGIVAKSVAGKEKIYEEVKIDSKRSSVFSQFFSIAESVSNRETLLDASGSDLFYNVKALLKDENISKLPETDTSFRIFAEIAQGVIEYEGGEFTEEKADFLSKLIKSFKYLEDKVDPNNKEAETLNISQAAAVVVNDEKFGEIANKTVTGIFQKAVQSVLNAPSAAATASTTAAASAAATQASASPDEAEELAAQKKQATEQETKELAEKAEKEKSYQQTKEMLEGLKGQDVAVAASGGAATIVCLVVCPPAALAVVAALMFYAFSRDGSSKEEEKKLKDFDLEGDAELAKKARYYYDGLQNATSPAVAMQGTNSIPNIANATGEFVDQASQEMDEEREELEQTRMARAGFGAGLSGARSHRDIDMDTDSEIDPLEYADFDFDDGAEWNPMQRPAGASKANPARNPANAKRSSSGDGADTDSESDVEPLDSERSEGKANRWVSRIWNSLFGKRNTGPIPVEGYHEGDGVLRPEVYQGDSEEESHSPFQAKQEEEVRQAAEVLRRNHSSQDGGTRSSSLPSVKKEQTHDI